MNAILDGVVAKLIGSAIGRTATHAAACDPHREAFDMMVATVALGHGSASEFAAPNDPRVVQHAALLQIIHQGGRALVD